MVGWMAPVLQRCPAPEDVVGEMARAQQGLADAARSLGGEAQPWTPHPDGSLNNNHQRAALVNNHAQAPPFTRPPSSMILPFIHS